MNIFVTGGTGFIGRHVLNTAVAQGHRVLAMQWRGAELTPTEYPGVEWMPASSLNDVSPESLKGFDAIIHLAASGVTPQPATWSECYKVNVAESLSLLEIAHAAGVKRAVIAGTYAEYGLSGLRFDPIPADAPLEPTDIYGASKASGFIAASALARVQKWPLAYLRIFSAFGEGQHPSNFWPSLRAAAFSGKDFPMTHGEQVRDFIPVEEVASAFLRAVAVPLEPGSPFIRNIGTGKPQSLRAFAEHWWKEWGAAGQLLVGAIPYRPNEVMKFVPEILPL